MIKDTCPKTEMRIPVKYLTKNWNQIKKLRGLVRQRTIPTAKIGTNFADKLRSLRRSESNMENIIMKYLFDELGSTRYKLVL
jgi:hypothetical protein